MAFARLSTYTGALCGVLFSISAQAQLRVVTYNTTGAPEAGMDIVLRSIGEETRNGIAKPIDVLLLQEQSWAAGLPNTQAFVNLLNSIYSGQGISYARGNLAGMGDTTQTIVYRADTVTLVSEAAIGTTMPSGQQRQTMRYELKPAGYEASFYIYNSHYKAGLGRDDPGDTLNTIRRFAEADAIRTDADALGTGVAAIYAGDFNFYDSDASEPAFGRLVSGGNGKANDPVNRIGRWHENDAFADVHTQSPCESGCGSAGSSMDDRFDFQLVTDALIDGEGLDYITDSYHAFGNNGSTYDMPINAAGNTIDFAANGVTSYTKSQILNVLATVTDHIPVVADFQLPAVLDVTTAAIPTTLVVGQAFQLAVTVTNGADVLVPGGADELDYTLTASGNVGGMFTGTDMALGTGNPHLLSLDTASPGMKSGLVRVTSTSQGVASGLVEIPISFDVVSGLLGDYNGNSLVDAADYVLWRNGGPLENDPTPGVDPEDYNIWRANFGRAAASSALSAVPEPATWMLAVTTASLFPRRRCRPSPCL